ncbi:MAG: phosphoethanolamine transferase CptA [Arsenophonus endosymbiont of Dermacentor nuttalli]
MFNPPISKKNNLVAFIWLLIFFLYFSTVIQIIVIITGQSNTIGLRESLLYSTLWLIPALVFSRHIRLITAIIGIILWLSSAIALAYYIVYGQQFSQSVMFIMFETNTHEASEFLTQYLSIKVITTLLVYTLIAIFLWTRIKPINISVSGKVILSTIIIGILFGAPFYKKVIKSNGDLDDLMPYLNAKMAYAAPWQFISGYFLYQNQLTNMEAILTNNAKIAPLKNLIDSNGVTPRTLVLVIGESTSKGRMSLYGYDRKTTPQLDALKVQYPDNFKIFTDVVTSRPYTIEVLQQALTFADQLQSELYKTHPSLMNMMKQAGYKAFWITNQQTITQRNTMLTAFSRQTDKQYYLNNDMAQSSRQYDTSVLTPFNEVLKDPAEKKFIIVHLLGTHMKYAYRYPKDEGIFDNKTDTMPANLSKSEQADYNAYDSAQYFNDKVVATLIKDFAASNENGFLLYFSDHGEEVFDTPPHHTLGRNEATPTRPMYEIPFIIWQSPQWIKIHQHHLDNMVNRPYSIMHLIHTWSDLAGLKYDGFDASKSVINKNFQPSPRYIGDPYSKQPLKTYDQLKK